MFLITIFVLLTVLVFVASYRLPDQKRILFAFVGMPIVSALFTILYITLRNHNHCVDVTYFDTRNLGKFCKTVAYRWLYDAPIVTYMASLTIGVALVVFCTVRRVLTHRGKLSHS